MPEQFLANSRSADNNYMREYWQKVSHIIAGQEEIVKQGVIYLPKLPAEHDEDYKFRLNCAKFTNVYRDVVETLASKPFEEEVKLTGEPPESLLDFVENVDGEGNNLTVFAAETFFNGINDALAWILIDYPDATVRTVEQMKKNNIRPFWSLIYAENVIDVRTKKVGAKRVISYARIMEPDSNTVREFTLEESGVVSWKTYAGTGDEYTQDKEGVLTIRQIPLVPFITGRRNGRGKFTFDAPLKDAVELQMILYQQESALEYAKRMTAFPMLSASGVNPEKNIDGTIKPIRVGPQTVLYAPVQGNGQVGDWRYIEISANSLKFLQEDIKETKQDLRELGKQPLTAKAGLTVITTAYAAGKSKSAVNAWGLRLKDALENALVITCEYLNIADTLYDPEVSVYDEYDVFSEDDFESVLSMREKGDISRKTVWAEARRRAILSAEFDPDVELAELLKETPADDPLDDAEEENPKPPIEEKDDETE